MHLSVYAMRFGRQEMMLFMGGNYRVQMKWPGELIRLLRSGLL